MLKGHILVDIDKTLSSAWHRDDLIEKGWDVYHENADKDAPITEMIDFVNASSYLFNVIGITARSRKYWPITQRWLVSNKVSFNDVLMRPNDDFRPSAEVKVDLATSYFGSIEKLKEKVAFIVDDEEKVIEAFSALGLTVLHCIARRV